MEFGSAWLASIQRTFFGAICKKPFNLSFFLNYFSLSKTVSCSTLFLSFFSIFLETVNWFSSIKSIHFFTWEFAYKRSSNSTFPNFNFVQLENCSSSLRSPSLTNCHFIKAHVKVDSHSWLPFSTLWRIHFSETTTLQHLHAKCNFSLSNLRSPTHFVSWFILYCFKTLQKGAMNETAKFASLVCYTILAIFKNCFFACVFVLIDGKEGEVNDKWFRSHFSVRKLSIDSRKRRRKGRQKKEWAGERTWAFLELRMTVSYFSDVYVRQFCNWCYKQ